jgi:hypothetical protein
MQILECEEKSRQKLAKLLLVIGENTKKITVKGKIIVVRT